MHASIGLHSDQQFMVAAESLLTCLYREERVMRGMLYAACSFLTSDQILTNVRKSELAVRDVKCRMGSACSLTAQWLM